MKVKITVNFIVDVPNDWILDDLSIFYNSNGDLCLTDGNREIEFNETHLVSVKKVGKS